VHDYCSSFYRCCSSHDSISYTTHPSPNPNSITISISHHPFITISTGPLPTPEKDLKQQQQSRDGSSSKQGTPSTGATTAAIARSHSSSNIIVPKGSNQSGVGPESMDLSDTLPGSSGNRRKNKDDSRGDVQDAYDAVRCTLHMLMMRSIEYSIHAMRCFVMCFACFRFLYVVINSLLHSLIIYFLLHPQSISVDFR